MQNRHYFQRADRAIKEKGGSYATGLGEKKKKKNLDTILLTFHINIPTNPSTD